MRFTFLDPQAQAFYPEWAPIARSAVAALRIAAAQNPHDRQLMSLIGELSMRSEPFRTMWATQDVYVHRKAPNGSVIPPSVPSSWPTKLSNRLAMRD